MIAAIKIGDDVNVVGMSGFGFVGKRRYMTIQKPASAKTASKPAAIDHPYAPAGTVYARSNALRCELVLCGHPKPPRYCQSDHRYTSRAGRAQGTAGVVLKLA